MMENELRKIEDEVGLEGLRVEQPTEALEVQSSSKQQCLDDPRDDLP